MSFPVALALVLLGIALSMLLTSRLKHNAFLSRCIVSRLLGAIVLAITTSVFAVEVMPAFPFGTRIIFQGDEITAGDHWPATHDFNHNFGQDYVCLIASKYGRLFPENQVVFLNQGVRGNTVTDLAARWQKDTIDAHPNLLSILIGVNDKESLAEFTQKYDQLLAGTVAALPKVHLFLCEPFRLPAPDAVGTDRIKMVAQLAAKYDATVVPLQRAFDEAFARYRQATFWLSDGRRPTAAGEQILADEWLRTATAFYHQETKVEPASEAAQPPVRTPDELPVFPVGSRILFQGDSITDGRDRDSSVFGQDYTYFIAAKYSALHPEREVTFINHGISGNKVNDLVARWQTDTLEVHPDLLSIFIGINDGDKIQELERSYDKLLADTIAALPQAQLVLCEMISRPFSDPEGTTVWTARAELVARLGEKYHLPVAHFQQAINEAYQRYGDTTYWIWDGVHPTAFGQQILADEWVRTVAPLYRSKGIQTLTPSAATPPSAVMKVKPVPDPALLVNPGKGYVQYYGTDDQYTKDYIGIGYTRWAWSVLEPKEGEYHWELIDKFLAQFAHFGKKTGIAVMSVSTGLGQYVTPKWVFDAGAKSMEAPDSTSPTGTQLIPESWEDPVFLAKMQAFVAAFGKRYDGNTNLAFVDIRDYGNWGEGHIGMLGHNPKLMLTPADSLQVNYLRPYFEAFPHTQLIVVWGSTRYDKPYDWAIAQGAGMRRDGILSEWSKDGSECLRAYGHAPAVFEYCDGYDETKKKGYWSTNSLWHYVDYGKPTYLQWSPEIFKENQEFCRRLGNRVGYHFVLQEAELPEAIVAGVPFPIQLKWFNDGVAPIYEPCQVALALLDANDQVVAREWLDESQPKNWLPDECRTERMQVKFSSVPAGTNRFAIGLFFNKLDAKPGYKLGIQGRTADGWYILN